jgi:voltage-gated potassium channel Kch
LSGVAILIWWHMRAILKSDYPAIQALEALAMITPLFLVSFAVAYFVMEHEAPTSFTQHLSRTDSLYFTITTFATVGYGDITAKTEVARVVVMVQMIMDLVIVGFGVRAIFGAVQMGRQRRAGLEGSIPSA